MKLSTTSTFLAVTASLFAAAGGAAPARAAPTIVAGGDEGVTTDLLDFNNGARIGSHTPEQAPGSSPNSFDPENALGRVESGGLEGGQRAIFADAAGGAGTTELMQFHTLSPVSLERFELSVGSDTDGNRGATAFRFFASLDGITYTKISDTTDTITNMWPYDTNYGSTVITVSEAFAVPVEAQFFRAEFDRATTAGTRVRELDGFGTPATPTVDPTLFDMSDLGGMTTNPTASSNVNPSNFDVRKAFGDTAPLGADNFDTNNNYIFADNATPDNGNGILGDGGETVDFIQWETTAKVELGGYQFQATGDGGALGNGDDNRDTALVRFLADLDDNGSLDPTAEVLDLFNFDGAANPINRLFENNISADLFRFEITNRTPAGARINEIDAILPLPVAVPEPSTFALAALGLLGLGLVARRRRT